jgi:hypothetical protein
MLRFHLLLRLSFFLAVSFLFFIGKAQDPVTEIKDSTGLKTYSVGKGETVLIGYDSAYILNRRIFKLYQDAYKTVKAGGNPSQKKLMDEYERLIALQDTMLKQKEEYYQGLKTNFDSLVSTSNRFADRTDMNVTAINQSLTNASNQLVNIKALLDDSLDKLKQENKKKFKWALGGFAVGIGVGTAIFLIAN